MCLCAPEVNFIFKEKIRGNWVFYFMGRREETNKKNQSVSGSFFFRTKGHLAVTLLWCARVCVRGLRCHISYPSLLHSLQPQLYWSDLGFTPWLQSGQSQSVVRVPLDTAEVFCRSLPIYSHPGHLETGLLSSRSRLFSLPRFLSSPANMSGGRARGSEVRGRLQQQKKKLEKYLGAESRCPGL